jgi:hypothetical protein
LKFIHKKPDLFNVSLNSQDYSDRTLLGDFTIVNISRIFTFYPKNYKRISSPFCTPVFYFILFYFKFYKKNLTLLMYH